MPFWEALDAKSLALILVALCTPVFLAIIVNAWLTGIAKSVGENHGLAPNTTFAHALRLPVLIIGLIFGLYFASVLLHERDIDWFYGSRWDSWIRILSTVSILIGFYVLYRLIIAAMRFASLKAGRDVNDLLLIRKIAAVFLGGLAIVSALNSMGVNIGPLIASLGVAGIAVALGLQETLGNWFAGITLALDKTFKPGDYVKLPTGEEGFVESVGWRSTRIKPYGESVIIVPNNKLTTNTVTNHYLPDSAVRVYIDASLGFENDLEYAEQVLIEIGKSVTKTTEGADTEFEPIVRYKSFGESNIEFTVILRADDFDKSFLLKHEFIKAMHREFVNRGITINYPVRQILEIPPIPESPAPVQERTGDVI